jgi:ABC-type enterobactin transport system permease subunit
MDGQDTFAQWKKIRNKKRILSVTAGLMAALFLLGAGFLAWQIRINQAQSVGYITVVVTQDP